MRLTIARGRHAALNIRVCGNINRRGFSNRRNIVGIPELSIDVAEGSAEGFPRIRYFVDYPVPPPRLTNEIRAPHRSPLRTEQNESSGEFLKHPSRHS